MNNVVVEEHKVDTDQQVVNPLDECRHAEGRYVVEQFYNNIPKQEDVKQWYAGFTPEGYNEWARVINFTEPAQIIDNVKLEAPEGLSIPRDAVCLDIGSGTGIVGQPLKRLASLIWKRWTCPQIFWMRCASVGSTATTTTFSLDRELTSSLPR